MAMNWTKIAMLVALVIALAAGPAHAGANLERELSPPGQMMHKLGRGVVNVLTSWVEIPRQIAIEWERTDPVSGFFVGGIKGIGWGFARLATGIYEVVTFPFPVPSGYVPLIQPEFVVTDIWGAGIPQLTDMRSNDPEYDSAIPVYPQRFNY